MENDRLNLNRIALLVDAKAEAFCTLSDRLWEIPELAFAEHKSCEEHIAALSREGFRIRRGENGLEVYVRCEIPSNVILAKAFAERFDGFSIGSNDLTQLTLGVDRDSAELAELFDEQDEAVRWMIESVIRKARAAGAKIGLCGQAPSDHPEFAAFLVECGIDSISITPDSFLAVKRRVAEAESKTKACTADLIEAGSRPSARARA